MIDWHCQPLHGGLAQKLGHSLGLFRFGGNARRHGETVSWSLVLKAMSPSEIGSNNPADWAYWKREILAYQSGLLDDLPGDLLAPRCFGVVEHPGEEFWIWLEDIPQEDNSNWSLERYGLAARHLGQFNGAYLNGYPLPNQPWLSRGRIRDWLTQGEAVIRDLPNLSQHPLARLWLNDDRVARIHRLWSEREMFLIALDRLPQSLCHHDAFRRNLITRPGPNGLDQTVAIDWALIGTGAIGEEIATLIAISLQFFEVDITQARALDAIVFEGYLEGLQDAGWNGDIRMVRFGFAAAATLFMGVGAVGLWLPGLLDEERSRIAEEALGHPLDYILGQFATLQNYLLDLGDEARGLVDIFDINNGSDHLTPDSR